jgi:site-specific recombinase XerD
MTEISEPLTALLDAFRDALLAQDASLRTITSYLSDLRHFVDCSQHTFQNDDLLSTTPTDVRQYRDFLQEQTPPATPATINRRLAALRRFFAWAKEAHLLESVPTERIRNVETQERGPQALDRKQWNRLIRAVEQAKGNQGVRDRCILLVLSHTDLRAGELAALRLTDITFGERPGQLLVRRGKGNKTRRVPLNADARAVICAYLQVRPQTDELYLLIGLRGDALSSHAIYNIVSRYGRLAGLDDVTPHTLRHMFARTLLSQGVSLNDVADLLGHSSLDTTRMYTRANEGYLATIISKLESW